jgi:anionic cell wall polymer biosynthesis LytR-Cps2A-Psr (LCP) family protein
MARQKCVMGAILREADPLTVLKNYEALANSAKHVLQTDLTIDALQRLVEVSAKTKNTKVTSVSFNPPLVNPANPDVVAIRERVAAAIAKSEAPPKAKVTATPTPTPGSTDALTAKQKKAAEKKAKKAAKKAAADAAAALAAAKAGGEPLALEDTCRYE